MRNFLPILLKHYGMGIIILILWKLNPEFMYKIGNTPWWVKKFGKEKTRAVMLIIGIILLVFGFLSHMKLVYFSKRLI